MRDGRWFALRAVSAMRRRESRGRAGVSSLGGDLRDVMARAMEYQSHDTAERQGPWAILPPDIVSANEGGVREKQEWENHRMKSMKRNGNFARMKRRPDETTGIDVAPSMARRQNERCRTK